MKIAVEVRLTPEQIAEVFCALDDDRQAKVFVEIARIAASWDVPQAVQWRRVGAHLRTCDCSTEEARQIVSDIAEGMNG